MTNNIDSLHLAFKDAQNKKDQKEMIKLTKSISVYYLGQKGKLKEAQSYLDSLMNDSDFIDDGPFWYLRGFVFKTIYNKQEKSNRESPSRIVALKSFVKSIEIDTTKEHVQENIKNIKYLTTTLYNDAAATLDSVNYPIAIRNFGVYLSYYPLFDTSAVNLKKKTIDFKLAIASLYTKMFESLRNEKYYNYAKREYAEILKLEDNQYARYNSVVLEANKESHEKKKLLADLELKQNKISLLDKDNLLNQLTIKQKQTEVDKQKAETEKREKEVSLLNKDKLLSLAEIKQQKLMRNIFIIGLLLFVLLTFLIFRNLQQNKKANIEITHQKHLVEEKNQEITDSINYALRIQQAILPDKKEVHLSLPQSFILFKPKDIVSGDFYFFHKNDTSVFIAAVDCTGHGVPGAFMSMVGSERLTDAVQKSNNTSEILALLNKGVKTSLKQSSKDESTRDGMDIALCSVDTKNRIVKYAGANRPVWIIRNGLTEVEEIKATKVAIGGLTEDKQHFDTHEIKLAEGDTFYICTDGYADQFSGHDGKKLMTRKLKEILVSIQNKSMPDQEQYLDNFVENWKAGTEQVDDILVIGIRV